MTRSGAARQLGEEYIIRPNERDPADAAAWVYRPAVHEEVLRVEDALRVTPSTALQLRARYVSQLDVETALDVLRAWPFLCSH